MAIDGEPKDGDYVRYVEQLINRGNAAPGQVVAQGRAMATTTAAPSPGQVLPNAKEGANKAGSLWETLSRRAAATPSTATSNSNAKTNGKQPADATLASLASKRRGAFAVALVSLAIAWQAIRMLFEALRQPYFEAHELIPVAFLLVFAGMLWKASRSQRPRGKHPPGRLPALFTLDNHGSDKPAR